MRLLTSWIFKWSYASNLTRCAAQREGNDRGSSGTRVVHLSPTFRLKRQARVHLAWHGMGLVPFRHIIYTLAYVSA
jgi:hypothetical protein